ncbi:MAG: hypothetical protein GEU90_05495 [Gemmatimonas sp.]|nr:hypothetical protein [Gemmatimonas sp.]
MRRMWAVFVIGAIVAVTMWRRTRRDSVGSRPAADKELAEGSVPKKEAMPAAFQTTGASSATSQREPSQSVVGWPGREPEASIVTVRPLREPADDDGGDGSPRSPGSERLSAESARPTHLADERHTDTGGDASEARPNQASSAPGWTGGSPPLPVHVPRPTYWPAVLAIGVVWTAWGTISSSILIFGGLAVFVIALAFWIREMIRAS